LARYAQWAGQSSGQAIHQLPALVSAAYAGRVDTLFVATADPLWGIFDPATEVAEIHPDRQPADEELLNFAVVQTLQNRGLVYSAEPQELSDNAPVAALLRY
jgi:hypothetical protein